MFLVGLAPGVAQTPPPQPTAGPGGSNYPHAKVIVKGPYVPFQYRGDLEFAYYLYEPADPKPPEAPVVLFLHGFQAHYRLLYRGWIDHLVRQGYTVAWVRWDQGLITTDRFMEQAETGWRDALLRLRINAFDAHVPPARTESGELLTATVGHSAGAWIGASLAGRSRFFWAGYPRPRAVVAIEPQRPFWVLPEPIELIDPSTKLLVLAGDDDTIVCDYSARQLWQRTTHIPDGNRDYLVAFSDAHGAPSLDSGHLMPLALALPGGADTMDFFATWKLSTAALHCAFRGDDCRTALGDGAPEQTGMGVWSDGTAVTPLLWLPDPEAYTPACRR